MKKKALSLFLVTAMAVSMVGCGSKDADKNTDKNTDKKDTEVAAATEKEAAAEDIEEINSEANHSDIEGEAE